MASFLAAERIGILILPVAPGESSSICRGAPPNLLVLMCLKACSQLHDRG
jgi:hypothetical protein